MLPEKLGALVLVMTVVAQSGWLPHLMNNVASTN
jgi:hypothetical protein